MASIPEPYAVTFHGRVVEAFSIHDSWGLVCQRLSFEGEICYLGVTICITAIEPKHQRGVSCGR